ncbi:YceI family protein [Nonomuraea sp. NPDC049695]|uniref:YceI family protein n=1 Tax=Nonomuraea sp. NPDC049695 TaxID=3154734 RepID=UPI00343193C3
MTATASTSPDSSPSAASPARSPSPYTGTAVDAQGLTRAGFEGSTAINRKDFGITYNAVLETGGVMISDKITLEFDLSAVKTA